MLAAIAATVAIGVAIGRMHDRAAPLGVRRTAGLPAVPRSGRPLVVALAAALVAPLVFAAPAHAAAFTVNSNGDAPDASTGNGVCATSAGVCTLRAALSEANATGAADTISFAIGSGHQTITPLSALPSISQPLTI